MTVEASSSTHGVVELSKRRFECSAPAGKFEQYDIDHLVTGNVLRGRIKYLEVHPGSPLNSAGALAFRLEDGTEVGVFLTVLHGDRHNLYLMLNLPGGDRDVLLGRVAGDEAIVRLMLDKRGRLSVQSNWMSRTVQLDNSKIVGRVVHCQSGRFQYVVGQY